MRDLIIAEARSWIGTPFHEEASVKGVGCDCKGLVAGVARELGRDEGHSEFAKAKAYFRHIDPKELERGLKSLFDPQEIPHPGDVLLLRVGGIPQHLAIMVDHGRMVHTYGKGPKMVIETPMGQIWTSAIVSAWKWRDSK